MYQQTKFQDIENLIWSRLFNLLKSRNLLETASVEDKIFLENEIKQIIIQEDVVYPDEMTEKLIEKVLNRILGLGPLEELINDDSVTEIMVNGKDLIFVEKKGIIEKTNLFFCSEDELLNVINKIVSQIGRRIDESSPMVDARLSDGSRVNAIIPPISLIGPVLTIRKFSKKTFDLKDLIELNSINKESAQMLEKFVDEKENILISGGTGTGKTSMLNALAKLIGQKERIVTIEDAAEIKLEHPNLVSLEARPQNIEGKGEITIRQLLKNALRMRPDRIIVGEIRGAESLDMLQAMNTGHQGSITTVHANAPLEALLRVETMVLMGNIELPLKAIRQQVIGGINIIIQLERLKTGERKVMRISRLSQNRQARESGEYILEDLYKNK